MNNNLKKALAAAVFCALLALPCGCGDEESPAPEAPAVSLSDVSGSDVSGTDVSSSDVSALGWYDALSAEEKAVADVVLRGAEAMNARDIDGYMATIDPDSKVYDITKEDTRLVFSRYRLAVTVDNLTVESIKNGTAVVTVTQTTLPLSLEDVLVPVSGSDVVSTADVVSNSDGVACYDPNPLTGSDKTGSFEPCVTVLTHTLTNRDGSWYISSTVVESYREVSTQWELLAAASAADPSVFVLSGTAPVLSSSDLVSGGDVSSADIDG